MSAETRGGSRPPDAMRPLKREKRYTAEEYLLMAKFNAIVDFLRGKRQPKSDELVLEDHKTALNLAQLSTYANLYANRTGEQKQRAQQMFNDRLANLQYLTRKNFGVDIPNNL